MRLSWCIFFSTSTNKHISYYLISVRKFYGFYPECLFNKNIQKRIIFIYNNDIAAARVELWSSSTNARYAESNSTNYILCKKQIKV